MKIIPESINVRCLGCGSILKSQISRSVGYSKKCAKKNNVHYPSDKEFFKNLDTLDIASKAYSMMDQFHNISRSEDFYFTQKQRLFLTKVLFRKVRDLGYTVMYDPSLSSNTQGIHRSYQNEILLNNSLTESNSLQVLLHEIIHATGTRANMDRPSFRYYYMPEYKLYEEMLAEFTSYMILTRFGLTTEYDLRKIVQYINYTKKTLDLDMHSHIFQKELFSEHVNEIMQFLNFF